MTPLNLKTNILSAFCIILVSTLCAGQQGNLTINQDKNIQILLETKKELNKNEPDSDRYKIQVYNGVRNGAEAAQREFNSNFSDWKSTIVYEPPNFKIWSASFNSRLEADRALKQIKGRFPAAFIFRPKK